MSARSFCMVTTFYPPHHFGGDAIYVNRLVNELARRGHQVTVVYTPDAHRLLRGMQRGEPVAHENVTLLALDGRLRSLAPLATYLSGRPAFRGRRLRDLFRREDFDVVHFHNISLVGGPGLLEYGSGVKLYTTHEHWLVCPMHTLWKLDRRPCEQPACLRCTLAFHRPPQLWRYTSLLQEAAKHVDAFLAPSRFTLRMHLERGFTGPFRHLPHFFPTAEALETSPLSPAERPYFLVASRLERLKGVQTVIELFRRYDAADLVIAGAGAHGPELRRQAMGLDHVRFLGLVPWDEMGPLYAGATALIAPSIGYETFGMTTLEAFAQRTPAIVRDLGGLPEMIEESGAGFVYRTEEELLDAMEALRTDPALRTQLGNRGHDAWLERWSEDPHLDAYFDVIEELSSTRSLVSAER